MNVMNSSFYDMIINAMIILITVYFVRGIMKNSRSNFEKLNARRKRHNI